MNPWTISRTALFIFLMTTMAAGADKTPPTYQKGTILNISRNHASCELEGIGIRKYKCKIEGQKMLECGKNDVPSTAPAPPAAAPSVKP